MGKNLHYTIIPFIEKALNSHNIVESLQMIEDDDFYIYLIKRKRGLSDLFVMLSDDYNFNDYSLITRHNILKNGGFILLARPEATYDGNNNLENKLGIGKIGKLLGALNQNDFWNYQPPKKDKK